MVDNTGDVVTENANEGTDTVRSGVTHTLAANVENLTLTGTSAINGTGNTLNNLIIGNGAANTLNGGSGDDTLDGAAGADSLLGGTGNDTYVVDNTGDVVTESTNSGTDTVQSGVTHTLAANVENLTLTGTAAINGTGNTLNNLIIGNSAANTLNGGSGNDTLDGAAGADSLMGGTGDDTYVVDNTGDVVTESASSGHRHRAVRHHPHPRRQCGKPHPHRHRRHQRHRQHPQQPDHRQQCRQHPVRGQRG